MSKKDYILLAAALRDVVEEVRRQGGFRRAVTVIEDALAADNPRFDREKFLEAVYGVQGDGGKK